jgi:hypothetical protein
MLPMRSERHALTPTNVDVTLAFTKIKRKRFTTSPSIICEKTTGEERDEQLLPCRPPPFLRLKIFF